MGSALLGMSKDAILTIFGSPTTGTSSVMTYVSAQRKTFLSLLLRDNKLAQVAFTSHSFTTADGIGIGNFNEPAVKNKFLPPTKTVDGKYNVYTLREGGFSIAVSSDGKTVGCVHANTDVPSKAFWP